MGMEETATTTAGSGAMEEVRVAGPKATMDISVGIRVYEGCQGNPTNPYHPQDGQRHQFGQQNHCVGGRLG